jgi:hypothetical protein
LIDERLHAGLAVLWRAYICAQDIGANLCELALPAQRLYDAGMTWADLHWLVTKRFAEYGETIANRSGRRKFRSNGGQLNQSSRLILTTAGASLAQQVFPERDRSLPAALLAPGPDPARSSIKLQTGADKKTSALKPRWDMIRRELSLAGSIIKRFRVPARNQETILAVFEEEGWVEHIHDPLPVTLNIDAPTRLHDAINRLNRCQINHLVRFHGDGKGTGIFWELCARPGTSG